MPIILVTLNLPHGKLQLKCCQKRKGVILFEIDSKQKDVILFEMEEYLFLIRGKWQMHYYVTLPSAFCAGQDYAHLSAVWHMQMQTMTVSYELNFAFQVSL